MRTNQQSLKYITQKDEIGADYQKWVSKFMGFDFEVHYKPDTKNRVADTLFHKHNGEVELGIMATTRVVQCGELEKEI